MHASLGEAQSPEPAGRGRRMLAQQGETWVITRRDYERSIERALEAVPERERLRFVYVELPDRFRRWQRDLRGLRVYYVLWQLAALKEARRLRRTLDFDLVWHLTWATAWYGSLAAAAGRPFVYGPVGGCVGTVWRLLPSIGWKGATYEVARMATHGIARYANPLARQSWRRADLILAQNVETRDWFPRRHRAKVRLFPNAVIREDLMRSGGPGSDQGNRQPSSPGDWSPSRAYPCASRRWFTFLIGVSWCAERGMTKGDFVVSRTGSVWRTESSGPVG